MKPKLLASLALLTSTTLSWAAGESTSASKGLQIYPKNLARQHVGSNLFLFNATNNSYSPTEAAAAWLDDDVTTGWPVMSGKQDYLLTLSEPMLLTNFAVSTRPASGTVTLYAGDEPAAPGAKSWTVVAKDIPLESINQHRLEKSFSRFAKYLLIETDIADPGPLFSLYVYGDRPAVTYQLSKRETPIDTRAIFGPFVNDKTSYSVAGLYAHSSISYATAQDGFVSWQKAIDDNPETSITLLPSTEQAGLVVKMDAAHQVSRLAVLTKAPAKGKLDFFVMPNGREVTEAAPADGVTPVSNPPATAAPVTAPSLQDLTPTITMVLDGTNARGSIDFPQVEGASVLVRWTPATEGEPLMLSELNAFNEISLSEYELAPEPAAVAELGYDASKSGPGKDFKDSKDAKGLAPVGDFLPSRAPYLPGALGFPPQVARRSAFLPPAPVSP